MNSVSKPLIVAIDGPSGSGKSSVAKKLAWSLGIPCIDTGAMYRTVALESIENKIDLSSEAEIANKAVELNFEFGWEEQVAWANVIYPNGRSRRLGLEIRSPEISMAASRIAGFRRVREVLVKKQREIGLKAGGVIEGRDAGTVIFSDAPFKFFITASPEERAARRYQELALNDPSIDMARVLAEVIRRDRQDAEREVDPLKVAEDAYVIDTSGIPLQEVVSRLIQKIKSKQS